jgi:galactitol-specific phosphotransferase system IIB component
MEYKAEQFDEKIDTIKSGFFSALDDFKKYYVYFNKNPEVNEFQNYYATSKGQLQGFNKDIFLTTNDIEKGIEALNQQMIIVKKKLEDEKKLNEELVKVVSGLENTKNGSEILIDDSKEEYNMQYYWNWSFLLSIAILSYIIFTSKSKNISVR